MQWGLKTGSWHFIRYLRENDTNVLGDSIVLSRFLSEGDDRGLIFEQLPFTHPLFILYSSGTSGPPKCIVHSAGVRTGPKHICSRPDADLGRVTPRQKRYWPGVRLRRR